MRFDIRGTKKAALMITAASLCCFGNAVAQDSAPVEEDAEARLDTVTVSGVRASLQRAQDIKADAGQVVEAVTFEDLGKFTDTNLADSLQRIPGVQIERNDSGIAGDRVSIRGLGPAFVSVTAQGRQPLTGGNEGINSIRQVNLDVFPSETISGILVYKTPSAELPETGLGGAVDVQLLRPLDYKTDSDKTYFGSVSAQMDYDSLTEESSPRFSGIAGGRFLGDTLGLYVSGITSDYEVGQNELFSRFGRFDLQFDDTGDGLADRTEEGVLAPVRVTTSLNRGEIERDAIAAGLQWRPTDSFELIVDYSLSQYINTGDRPYGDIWLSRGDDSLYTGVSGANGGFVVEDGRLLALDTNDLTFNGEPDGRVLFEGQPLLFDHDQEAEIFGANASYSGDNWKISGDVSFSEGSYDRELRLFAGASELPSTDTFVFDGRPTVPIAEGLGDVRAILNDAPFIFIYNIYENSSEAQALRLDYEYEVNPNLTLKTGIRYQEYDVNLDATTDLAFAPNEDLGFTTEAAEALPGVLYSSANTSFLQDFGFGVVLPESSFAAAASVVPLLVNDDYRDSPTAFVDPNIQFSAVEKTTALYAQSDFGGSLFDVPVDGNFGVRAVRTELTSTAESGLQFRNFDGSTESQELITVTDTNEYWEFLPSLNLNFAVTDNTNLRLGASRVMSRPEFDLTAPRNSLTLLNPDDPLNDLSQNASGRAGNTQLKAATAKMFDVTLEHYTPNDGAIYASVFYKDIADFVVTQVEEDVTLPGVDGILFNVTQPVNATTATVAGLELGFNQPLTFLASPWDGFGVLANYTYVDSQVEVDAGDFVNGLPGTSEHNANAVIYYEKYGFGARLAYVYRSDYFAAIGGGTDRGAEPTFTEAEDQLNANLSYDINDYVQVYAAGTNLTESDRRDFIGDEAFFRSFVQRPRTFSLGARLSF